jgi:hypothetical protein
MSSRWKQLAIQAGLFTALGASAIAGDAGTPFSDDVLDQHLLPPITTVSQPGPDCTPQIQSPCLTPQQPGAMSPAAPSPYATSPYGTSPSMGAPSATAQSPLFGQGTGGQSLASAFEGGGVGGPSFGNVPAMIGDIFSGSPTLPQSGSGPLGVFNNVPFPTTPTTGFLKLADDTSPIPRDRLIVDYSFFQNVPLTNNGLNVNRFALGFEKTIGDRFSIEVVAPFASTLNSDVFVDTPGDQLNSNDVEFGDVTMWLKALLYKGPTYGISAGLGVMAPTAKALTVSLQNGTTGTPDLYRISNSETFLMPFIGSVWTPNDKFFVQQFLQMSFTPNANSVYQNESFGTGDDHVFTGKLHDPAFIYYDISAGYWLFRDCPGSCDLITGVAGIFEVHYNQSLSNFDSIPLSPNTGWTTPGQNVVIGGGSTFTSLNLTAGFVTEIRENALLFVGATVPTIGGSGHEFDYQIMVNFNYLFGRSSKGYGSNIAGVPSTL